MRIDIATTTSTLRAENGSLNTALDQNQSQQSILKQALLGPSCKGAAFSAITSRIQDLRIPVAQAQYVAMEAIRGCNDVNISSLEGLPTTSSGVLDTDECQRLIDDARRQIGQLQSLQNSLHLRANNANPPMSNFNDPYPAMMDQMQGVIRDLEAKKKAASDYDVRSGSIYSQAQQAVSGSLSKATASVMSYVNTGSYGDTSWKSGIYKAYNDAVSRQKERKLIELSKMGENGTPIISDDCRFIYWKGVKYEIVGIDGEMGDGVDVVWRVVGSTTHNLDEFSGAYFSAHFGEGMSYDENGRTNKGARIAGAVSFIGGIGTAAKDSWNKSTLTFKFEENGTGGYRVLILGKEEYPNGTTYFSDKFYAPSAHQFAANLYTSNTGNSTAPFLVSMYDISCYYDPARNDADRYTSHFYFNENKQLMQRAIQFPEDRIYITVVGGIVEKINITNDIYKDANTEATGFYKDKIEEAKEW